MSDLLEKFLRYIFLSILCINSIVGENRICTNSLKKAYYIRYTDKHTFYLSSTLSQYYSLCEIWGGFKDIIHRIVKKEEIFREKTILKIFSIIGCNFDYKLKISNKIKFLTRINIFPYYNYFTSFHIRDLLSLDLGIELKYKRNKNWSFSITLGYCFIDINAESKILPFDKNLLLDITLGKYERVDGFYIQVGRLRTNIFQLNKNSLIHTLLNLVSCHIGFNLTKCYKRRNNKKLFEMV